MRTRYTSVGTAHLGHPKNEVEESTKEYAKSLEKIANDKALKMLTKSERANLKKIADLLKNEENETEEAVHGI
jgi:hypothetical protein